MFTHILKECVLNDPDYFLGHIGEDDFVAILPHYQVEPVFTEIIRRFDESICNFYDKHHLTNTLFVKNRDGEQTFFTLMTLSIAIMTNEFYLYDNVADCFEIARIKV